jgi:hypothetical protein
VIMRFAGWNDIPVGYGARFDTASAPAWLRLLFHTPFVDCFAYPLLVRRGLGFLHPDAGWPEQSLGVVHAGWRLDDPDHAAPGSVAELRSVEDLSLDLR